eukprot:scaffold256449_cov28-Tisochrysis_lutea.AAC.2
MRLTKACENKPQFWAPLECVRPSATATSEGLETHHSVDEAYTPPHPYHGKKARPDDQGALAAAQTVLMEANHRLNEDGAFVKLCQSCQMRDAADGRRTLPSFSQTRRTLKGYGGVR